MVAPGFHLRHRCFYLSFPLCHRGFRESKSITAMSIQIDEPCFIVFRHKWCQEIKNMIVPDNTMNKDNTVTLPHLQISIHLKIHLKIQLKISHDMSSRVCLSRCCGIGSQGSARISKLLHNQWSWLKQLVSGNFVVYFVRIYIPLDSVGGYKSW